jgi:hypothetical protein
MDKTMPLPGRVARSEEYVFLEKLQYLAAGGRLSKTSAPFSAYAENEAGVFSAAGRRQKDGRWCATAPSRIKMAHDRWPRF